MKCNKHIGIITWHYYDNYGSALQAYALQTAIDKMNYKSQIINYRNPAFGKAKKSTDFLKALINNISPYFGEKFNKRFSYPFISFRYKYLNETKLIYDELILSKIAKRFDYIICGSDQIWAPNVFNPVYMINFADGKNTKKISYAASIGLNSIPNELINKYKDLLSDYSAISVREEIGKKILFKSCNIDSTVVADPTLLLTASDYRSIQKSVKTEGQYIFCYFLNSNNNYKSVVRRYAETHGFRVYGFSAKESDYAWISNEKRLGPSEFLWLIDNSEGVFTDSYHGTIFSLLFHKKFWTFRRFSEEDPICQNSRIDQLCKVFPIKNRIISVTSIPNDCIDTDYSEFENALKKYKELSLRFLKEALE